MTTPATKPTAPTATPKTRKPRTFRYDTGRTRDTGRYSSGYRTFRDGSYREDFGTDR